MGLRPLPLWLLLLAGCAERPVSSDVIVSDSAGVRLVVNTGPDRPLDWQVRRVLMIGGSADVDPFSGIGQRIASDGAGDIYVLDAQGHRVLRYSPAGELRRSYGRRGGGPGELERPDTLLVAGDSLLLVLDNAKRAFVRFRLDGAAADQLSLPSYRGSGGGALLAGRHVHAPIRAGIQRLVIDGGADGEHVLATRTLPAGKEVRIERCQLTLGGMLPYLTSYLLWHGSDSTLLVHAADDYTIDVFTGAELRLRVRRDVPAVTVTRALAVAAAEREFGDDGFIITTPLGRCSLTPDEMVELNGHVPTIPPVSGVIVGPDGALWVRRPMPDGAERIDLFAADGVYQGTLPPGTPLPVTFLPGARFAVVERDALGAEIVAIYEIIR